jgi:hypothetical protein
MRPDATRELWLGLLALQNGLVGRAHLAAVDGLGTYDNRRPYHAMRFVQGQSLHEAAAAFHNDATLKSVAGLRDPFAVNRS